MRFGSYLYRCMWMPVLAKVCCFATPGDRQSLVHTMVLQEKGTKTSESAFRGETIRKFSGCKLVQSHSWVRGHESVESDGSVERPHHFVR